MTEDLAITALAALAQQARLRCFRALVGAAPVGLTPGALAATLGISPSTLSFHLKELSHAGLAESRQDGRFVIYTARYETMNALLGYLTDNCCGGNPCSPVCEPACVPSKEPT